jgi:hypothetical protein
MSQHRQDTIEILAEQRRDELPPTLHRVGRRVGGVEMLPLVFGAAGGALVLALVLLVIGNLVAAIALLALAGVLGAFARAGIRRDPDSWVARVWLRATDRLGSQARVIAVSTGEWSRAAVGLTRGRLRRLRLRRELRDQLRPLGEAVYREQSERAEAIKAHAAALERELLDSRREDAVVVGAARETVERERALAEPTRAMPRLPEDAVER